MSRYLLKAANSIISFIVILALCIAGLYAAYALWDNNRIYANAADVQADMLKLKPESIEDKESFADLLRINPDVCAWLTLDQTKIDHPVLQGKTNFEYINKDVYGEFALAGSIYLDSRNDKYFTDSYSLLYGHHMEKSQMFGDLDLYGDKIFFDTNKTGTLLLPDKAYELEIFAYLLVNASDDYIFEVEKWQSNINELIPYVEQKATYLHVDSINKLKDMDDPQVLALSTCASGFTDARTIILAVMNPIG